MAQIQNSYTFTNLISQPMTAQKLFIGGFPPETTEGILLT